MRATRNQVSGMLLLGVVLLASALAVPGNRIGAQGQASDGLADVMPPRFELDPSWPPPQGDRSLPELNRVAYGSPSVSVAIDSDDHVWILQVPSPESRTAEAEGATIPRVFEFDSAGNLLQGWGGPGEGYQWMQAPDPSPMWPAGTPAEHGLFVDHDGNVWVTGNGHVALKFSHDGQFLLQIGELGRTNGSNDRGLLGSSTDLAVDAATNELYIADGYINRRVIVFDADTGAYRRHFGAFGRRPTDLQLLEDRNGLIADPGEFYFPAGPPQPQWLSVHCVRVSNDGLVYVCDRNRNRIHVLRTDGTFLRELYVSPDTPVDLGFLPESRGVSRSALTAPRGDGPPQAAGFGAPSTVGFSSDPEQRYLYVGDNQNSKIWIYRRSDLRMLGSIPTLASGNHYLTVDSQGNIYNSKLQKFVFKGVPSLDELLNRSGVTRR